MFQHLIALTNWVPFIMIFQHHHWLCVLYHHSFFQLHVPKWAVSETTTPRIPHRIATTWAPEASNSPICTKLSTPSSRSLFSLNSFQFVGIFVTEFMTTWVVGASNSQICTKPSNPSPCFRNSIKTHSLIPMLWMLRFNVCSLGYVSHCHKHDLVNLEFDPISHLRCDWLIGPDHWTSKWILNRVFKASKEERSWTAEIIMLR